MIRRPTPPSAALRWWRDALANGVTVVHESEPQPGYYKTRLVKAGPWVPARIWWHQIIDRTTGELVDDEQLMCLVNLQSRDPVRVWIGLAKHPITAEAYADMVRLIHWAGSNDPLNPVLNPTQPVDLTRRISRPCPTTT